MSLDDDTDQKRLSAALESNGYIEFFKTIDKDYPSVVWAVYGLIETNEIVVKASSGSQVVLQAAPSNLVMPHMGDRMFGIDTADSELASELSLRIWEKHGDQLQKASEE
ncbi:hypothetical protein [Salinisphaera aquimarina]|uniref:Uncharacterized protein n=1 Tax=Salinisphaera aquimarina TaxID=2094031 RepID=A0ABV7EQU9_9GAMM